MALLSATDDERSESFARGDIFNIRTDREAITKALSEVQEATVIFYGMLCIGGAVVLSDVIGLIDVEYDLPMVVMYVILVGAVYLHGKAGAEKVR